jgi:hypothetical protein
VTVIEVWLVVAGGSTSTKESVALYVIDTASGLVGPGETACMAKATWVAPSVAGSVVLADGLRLTQLGNLNHGGQELSFNPPSSPAGQTSSGAPSEPFSCTGVVVGWSPTVSQSPPDSKTPETVIVRVPKRGTVVVVEVVEVVEVVVVLT